MELAEQIGSLTTLEESYLPEARPARATSVAQIFGGWLRPSVAATVVTGFATFGVTAVQGIILARLLGPYARGEFGTAILYTTSLTYIGLLGTQYAIARRAARNPEYGVQLSQLALRLGVVTGLGTAIVITVLAFTTLPEAKQYLAALCVVCCAGLAV